MTKQVLIIEPQKKSDLSERMVACHREKATQFCLHTRDLEDLGPFPTWDAAVEAARKIQPNVRFN